MTSAPLPIEHFTDLRHLGQAGARVTIAVEGADLVRLAHWAEVDAVDSFVATIDLTKLSKTRFQLAGHLHAEIVQSCVVTLAPVRSHITRDFMRELHLMSRARHMPEPPVILTLTPGDDEAPEEIESPSYDLATPVLEELILGIDPYPRAPGVSFAAARTGEATPASPFAALKALKNR